MINSLRKDSHITLGLCVPKITVPPRNGAGASERKEYRNAPVNNSIGISVNKPAEINFGGLSSRTLANDSEFKLLVEAAKEIVGKGKKEFKGVMQLMKDAADFLIPQVQKEGEKAKTPKEPSEIVKKFVDANKILLQKKIDEATELTKEEKTVWLNDNLNQKNTIKRPKMIPDPNDSSKKIIELRAEPEELREIIVSSFEVATYCIPAVDKNPWYAKSTHLDYFLQLAEKNSVAFSATFALLLTGIFRPSAIVALPCDKKNKDDQKYAAAHSIASGIIGFIVATAVSKPIADGLKKILDKPANYIKDEKRAQYLEASIKLSDATKHWVTRGVDVAMAVPKAFITVALIPPILKYIFGWEKKKHANKPINIQTNCNQNKNDNIRVKTADGGIK